jgi:hypothetical protein
MVIRMSEKNFKRFTSLVITLAITWFSLGVGISLFG